jgi:hypothetical protein
MRLLRILRSSAATEGGGVLALDPVQPDQTGITTAGATLPHVKGYPSRHHRKQTVRVVVGDEHSDETFIGPRGAVELLAPILAHIAAGLGVSVVPAHAERTTQQPPTAHVSAIPDRVARRWRDRLPEGRCSDRLS